MNQRITCFINQFGLPQAINRPHIPATKQLDLSGLDGQALIKITTKQVIIKFARTLARLEQM